MEKKTRVWILDEIATMQEEARPLREHQTLQRARECIQQFLERPEVIDTVLLAGYGRTSHEFEETMNQLSSEESRKEFVRQIMLRCKTVSLASTLEYRFRGPWAEWWPPTHAEAQAAKNETRWSEHATARELAEVVDDVRQTYPNAHVLSIPCCRDCIEKLDFAAEKGTEFFTPFLFEKRKCPICERRRRKIGIWMRGNMFDERNRPVPPGEQS